MVGKMILLREHAYADFFSTARIHTGRLLWLTAGLLYGLFSLYSNADYIASFESTVLRYAIVPAIFIGSGLIMAFLSKTGLSLVLWAAGKGLGGKAGLKQMMLAGSILLLPGMLAIPYMTGLSGILPLTLLAVSVIWIFLVTINITRVTQQLSQTKSIAVSTLFILFMTSIVYIVSP